MRCRAPARDRGAAALEFVGVLPLLLLAALVALQFGIVGWTVVSANQAARDAARAATLGRDPRAAAQAALPGTLEAVVSGGPGGSSHRYTITVPIPSVIGVSLGSVSRTVEMPGIR